MINRQNNPIEMHLRRDPSDLRDLEEFGPVSNHTEYPVNHIATS